MLVNLDAVVTIIVNHIKTTYNSSDFPNNWIPCAPETMPEEGEKGY